jgi:hypothetical protein
VKREHSPIVIKAIQRYHKGTSESVAPFSASLLNEPGNSQRLDDIFQDANKYYNYLKGNMSSEPGWMRTPEEGTIKSWLICSHHTFSTRNE